MSDIRNCCSMIYQDFCKYGLSLKENICFNREVDEELFAKLSTGLGIKEVTDNLTNGVDTLLRTDVNYENAIDLSSGQWQRVAIMRTLITKNSVFVMDEPSSALDIESEELLYNAVNR